MNRGIPILGISLLVVSSRMLAQQAGWPTIEPVEVGRRYNLPGAGLIDTPLRLILRDLKSAPAYRLECHNGNYDVDSEYSYSRGPTPARSGS